jgi:prevent-host-death family protein
MKMVNIHEAKTHLSRLVEEAADGKEIVIAKAGRPRARLVPYQNERKPRVPGRLKGQIVMADNFDDPLPDEMLRAFGMKK